MAATARGGGHQTSRACERIFGEAGSATSHCTDAPRSPTTRPTVRGDGAPITNVGEPQCGTNIINPLGNAALSTIAAAVPVVTRLVLIASGKVKAHLAAIIALIVANVITIAIFTMPAHMSIRASLLGVVVGFFPIGWIVLRLTSTRSRRWC